MVCKKCGYQNSLGATFCAGCGQKLTESNNTPQKKKMPNMVIAMLAGLACILLVVLFSKTFQAASKNTLREAIEKHANTFSNSMAVRNDGVAIFRGDALVGWTDIASVPDTSEEMKIPVALRWDGTVLTGDNNPTVESWRNVVAIYVDGSEIIGLCQDGTVVSTNPDNICNTWTNIETIQVSNTPSCIFAVTKDGKVLASNGYFDLSSWRDIVQIDCGLDIVGLRRDGTVIYFDGYSTSVMEGWTDVVSVKCDFGVAALRSDGTVLSNLEALSYSLTENNELLDFSEWKDIAEIDVCGSACVGLKTDGTVVANGDFLSQTSEELDLSEWTNVVEIKYTDYDIHGLKADGTVLGHTPISGGTFSRYHDIQIPARKQNIAKKDPPVVDQKDAPTSALSNTSTSNVATIVDERALRDAIAKHAVTFNSNMAVRNDGMAMFRYGVIEGWSNVASVGEVDSYYEMPIALRWDGTVLTGDNNPIIAEWRNIIAIYVYFDEIIGLCLDGTVVSTNPESSCTSWTNVESIHVPRTVIGLLGITKDGKVLSEKEDDDLSAWTDIIQVNSGMGVVGLRQDGTVLYSNGSGTQVMDGWTDVVAVDCYWDIMALRSDGTILTTAKEVYGTPLDFAGWNNVVAIDVDGYDYIGLKADGSVIATGGFEYVDEELDLSKWKDMVEVRSAGYSMIGLRADGTVLYYNGPNIEYLFYDVQLPD